MPICTSVKSGVTLSGQTSTARGGGSTSLFFARHQRERASSASALGGGAVHQSLHVVIRRVGLSSRINAVRIFERVRGRIPAPDGQIESAGIGDRVVDHDDLLMLRTAERRFAVETELHLIRRIPVERKLRKHFALERIEHREIPQQQPHRQSGPPLHERREKVAKRNRKSVIGLAALADKARAAVDVPAEDEDGVRALMKLSRSAR